VSSSLFDDSPIFYDISKPLNTFDCSGNMIQFIPYIGIDSETGNIAVFGEMSRDTFCDATFMLEARKDDTSISSRIFSFFLFRFL
jgi:hypothetical protein